jgi:hypothetical protein
MALLETAPPPATIPGTHALSVARRPGFQIFDANDLIGSDSHDLFYQSTVEISGGQHADYLKNASDDPAKRHAVFTAGANEFRSLHLPATQVILSRLTESIRSMALDPHLTAEDATGNVVPHSGLETWNPDRIELDRYSFSSGQDPSLSKEYRSGQHLGSYVTALIMLHGTRSIDVAKQPDLRDRGNWSPLLSRRQIMLLRAPGLLEGGDDIAPGYKLGKIYPSPNNLLMTVFNHTLEAPEPAKP